MEKQPNIKALQELIMAWSYKAIGNSTAMLNGARNTDCIVIVHNRSAAKSFSTNREEEKKFRGVDELCHCLKGIRKPVLIDHYALVSLISGALKETAQEARKDGMEKAAKIAEDAFMNSVVPRHTAVRDFIAQAIRKAKEKV